MFDPTQLNRQILAKFLPDQRAIKAFESLINQVGLSIPLSIAQIQLLVEELAIAAGLTDSKAGQALSLLESISNSLSVLASAPPVDLTPRQDDIDLDFIREEVALLRQQVGDLTLAADPLGSAGGISPSTLKLIIGTDVQAYDADLDTWASITPGANVTTALAVAVGTDGAFVVKAGALGTPSSGSLANCTAYPGTSTLVTVGALNSGSITSGFGAIDIGNDSFVGGTITGTTLTTTISPAMLMADEASTGARLWIRKYSDVFGASIGVALDALNTAAGAIVPIGIRGLTVAIIGDTTLTGALRATTTIRPGGYTVATLPAGTAGMKAYVTDALAPAFLVLLASGGTAYSGAQYNGTQWVGD